MVNEITQEFLKSNSSELKELDRICNRVTKVLNYHYHLELEQCKKRLWKRVVQLECANDDYLRDIGILSTQLTSPSNANVIKNEKRELEGIKKGFLIEKNMNDRQQTSNVRCELEDCLSQSSNQSNPTMSDDPDFAECEKRILGISLTNEQDAYSSADEE